MEKHARSVVSTNTKLTWGQLIAQIVPQILSLQLAASQIPPVNVTLGTREEMEAHAHCAAKARINLVWVLLVQTVPRIQYLHLEAPQTPPVNVSVGTREKMEAHARSAVSTNTKLAWDLLFALIVFQTLSLQQAASPVIATLGGREHIEAHARSAVSTNTKQAWAQPIAQIVQQTLSLQLAASQIPHVNARLGIQEKMEARARSASQAVIIKLVWDLRGAMIA